MRKLILLPLVLFFTFGSYSQTVEGTSNKLFISVGKAKTGNSDVDKNIPVTTVKRANVYALIIGNEDYSSYQSGLENEVNVDFAENDARLFKEYLVKTMGLEERNVDLRINATLGQMKQGIAKLKRISEVNEGKAELIFYYSGHGLPDEKTKEGYIIPVDVSGSDLESAIKINKLYADLTEFPAEKITVFLDACFSGGARNESLVKLKGVKVKPADGTLHGNLVVFSSSTGEESSAVYKEKQHGIFTYFVLKKLQSTKGDLSYKELADYVYDKVRLESVLVNDRKQSPQIKGSSAVRNEWEKWRFK